MRKEFYFNPQVEDITKYMDRAVKYIRSIKSGLILKDGRCLAKELSEEEQKELLNYIYTEAYQYMLISSGKHRQHQIDFGADKEDFIMNFFLVIVDCLEDFNSEEYISKGGKAVIFDTFLDELSKDAVRMTYAGIHGVNVNVEKNMQDINGLVRRIAKEERILESQVSDEMVIDAYWRSMSKTEVRSLRNFYQKKSSMQEMEEDGTTLKPFFEEDLMCENELDEVFDMLDLDVEKLFETLFEKLTDLEKFFVLLHIGTCDEKYYSMTADELCCDSMLIKLVEKDHKFKDKIMVGDICCERPGRSADPNNKAIEIKNVRFVNKRIVTYNKAKAKSILEKLGASLNMGDVKGNCGVKFFMRKWNGLVKNIHE